MTLIVCPLSQVERIAETRAPSHMITLLDPTFRVPTPAGVEKHLRVGVNDIVAPAEGRICPDESLIDRLLAFGRDWDAFRPILIHCWAGISRSSATAFILACQHSPDTDEATIARVLRSASAIAHPNRRIVALADVAMGRNGRMIAAVEAMGPGDVTVEENTPFDLPARYP